MAIPSQGGQTFTSKLCSDRRLLLMSRSVEDELGRICNALVSSIVVDSLTLRLYFRLLLSVIEVAINCSELLIGGVMIIAAGLI